MALVKRFDMKGMYQGKNRQSPPENYFRRATNVWQDRSGTYRPVYPMGIQLGDDSGRIIQTLFTKYFQGKIFQGYAYDTLGNGDAIDFYDEYRTIDSSGSSFPIKSFNSSFGALGLSGKNSDRNAYSSTTIDKKLYFTGGDGLIKKFDGYVVTRSSEPTPYFSCAQYSTSGIVRWVRIIDVRIGLDGELVASQVLEFPVNNTTISLNISGTDLVGQPQVSPTFRQTNDRLLSLDGDVFSEGSGTTTYNAGTQEIVATCFDFRANVGDWIIYKDNGYIGTSSSGLGWLYAFKIKNISGSDLILDVSTSRTYSKANLTWVDSSTLSIDWNTLVAGETFKYGTDRWALVYSTADATRTGAYTLRDQIPARYISITPSTFYPVSISLSSSPPPEVRLFGGQITTDLASWYDVGTTKLPTVALPVKGVTNYQNLLVSYDDNAIYYSDTTLGGSVEMLNGLSNLVPPGEEYGNIVCVEGCEDFIFISRERKNYVLVGDIATGNIRIEEVNPEVLGAFSSRSAIAVLGGIVFVSRQGVFYVNSAGTTKELSSDISRLFGTNFSTPVDPDECIFTPYKMTDKDGFIDGNIVSIKYDADRALLAVMYSRFPTGVSTGWNMETSLGVYNLNNGSWYEWSGDSARDIEFLPKYSPSGFTSGVDTSGRFEGSLILASQLFKKESIFATNATGSEEREYILATQWQSLGEPSLEKQMTQFKWWGELQTCFVSHQEDWSKYVTPNTAPIGNLTRVRYDSEEGVFIHKQRMNSSRAQVFSIVIKFLGLPLFRNWYFEGYEIEGNLIQEGMKK